MDNGINPSAPIGSSSDATIESQRTVVKWFDARKGFGFLVGPEGIDVFIHFSVIEQDSGFRALKDGEEVTYSARRGPKGWSATSVRALRLEEGTADA